MFRIGVLELGITCALIALAIIIPTIISRSYARLNKRLHKIERDLEKKK